MPVTGSRIPSVNAFSGAIELYQASQDVTDSTEAITFNVISPVSMMERVQKSDGWIDVRGVVRGTLVVETSTHSADIAVKSKATTHADAEDLVASSSIATGSNSKLLDAESLEGIAWVKVEVVATTPGDNGTVMAELYVV